MGPSIIRTLAIFSGFLTPLSLKPVDKILQNSETGQTMVWEFSWNSFQSIQDLSCHLLFWKKIRSEILNQNKEIATCHERRNIFKSSEDKKKYNE